jgi:hypothetical protein
MATESSELPIQTAIWVTCHSRMIAEKRYRLYDNISHLLLSWLSLSVIAWVVIRGSQSPSAALDTYTAVLSVFVFAISIIVFGFRFGETATLHRECYLRLQKLYDSEPDAELLTGKYHEILGAYSNHADKDFEALVIEKTLLHHRKMWGKDGEQINWTSSMLVKFVLRATTFWLLTIILFLLGLMPYLLVFKLL